jgi:hypothetical protein
VDGEDPLDGDQMLASVAKFLIDGGEEDAASILLACSLSVWTSGDSWYVGDEVHYAVHVEITGPRAAYDALNRPNPVGASIDRALEATLPTGFYIKHRDVKAELLDLDPDWRAELLEIARGRGVHNQAVGLERGRLWSGLRFRSQSEVRIAQALDRAGVMFFPNSKARVNGKGGRVNREPDFLVCHDGRWAILEVDGEPFHPPSRTVADHERDRLFRAHGVVVVEHFDATRCYEDSDGVVREFLSIMRSSAAPS